MISFIAVLSLLSIVFVGVAASGADGGPVYVSIEGKSVVATGEKWQYVVRAIGGPGSLEGGNFSCRAELVGPDISGSLVSPSSGVSASGVFFLNVTAPSAPQDVTLVVNVTSSTALSSDRAVKTYPIKVLAPVVIQVSVKNSGDFDVLGIPVAFAVDGREVHETTVDVSSLSSKTVTYNWTDPEMSQGEHVITVTLDPDSRFVEFETGGSVYTTTIYVGKPSYGMVDLLLAVLFIMSIVIILYVYSRPKRRRMR